MLPWICFCIVLLGVTPAWSQLQVIPYETSSTPTDDGQMRTPPPVSGVSYPMLVGSQTRSNYMGVGVLLNTAYDDNVSPGADYTPISDTIYSILPTITFNKTTVRQHLSLQYSPGFTLYQHTSALNAVNQTASIGFQFRLSEHTNLNLSDSFLKTSNVFDQLYPMTGANISGSAQAQPAQVVAPYGGFLTNTANVGLTNQISRDEMIGVSGISTVNQYPNTGQVSNFYNSNSYGGTVFYARRLSGQHYIGVTYEYVRTLANPGSPQDSSTDAQIKVQTQTFDFFYTVYLSPTFSFSLLAGPQYFDASQPSLPSTSSWTPSVAASIGWQRSHSSFAASYSKSVAGSNGLAGVFDSNNANVSWRWQMAKTWTAALTGIYFGDKNVAPLVSSISGGHTISGTFSMQHSMGEHLTAEIGYARLHQSYSDITVISKNPDSDRVYVSISYQFTRPLGR
jgi:hypothetical protein